MKEKMIKMFSSAKLTVQKYSPELLLGIGIAGTVVSTVIACKQTLKINDILQEKKELMNDIKHGLEDEDNTYTQDIANRDTTLVYVQTGVKLVKLYAPAIMLGGLSIASIITGHKILKKRNVAIAAAYIAVSNSFKKYRSNVIEEMGAGFDQQMRFGIKAKKVKEKDKETGKTKTETEYDLTEVKLEESDFAKFFDESCDGWQKDPEYNLMYLRRQQDYANEMLKNRGFLFLNEVYDLLDIPRTKAGQIVGWIYDPENELKRNESTFDNYVDFGIYNLSDEAKRRFVNGVEKNILLDFNVDGPIFELLDNARMMRGR